MTILANLNPAQQAELASAVVGAQRSVQSGVWSPIGSIYRVLLNGTGTVQIDARNAVGMVTTNVASYTLTAATNLLDYPYFGDDATDIMPTLTGTATMRVL